MVSDSDNIDQLFQDSLERYEKNPGDNVWDEVDKTISRDDQLKYFRQKCRETAIYSVFILLAFCIPLIVENSGTKNFILPKQSPVPAGTLPYIQKPILPLDVPDRNKNKKTSVTADERGRVFITCHPPGYVEIKRMSAFPVSLKDRTVALPEIKFDHLNGTVYTIVRLKPKAVGRFSITPYFSKDFAGYNFNDHDITGVNGKEIESRERNIFAASAGVFLNYELNRNWVIQSGISYSWSNNKIDSANSYAVKNDDGIVQFKFNTSSGYSYLKSPGIFTPVQGDSLSMAQTYTQLRYLTIPVLISYRIPIGRFSILAGGGLTMHVLTHAALQTVIYGHGYEEDESEIAIRGMKKVNFGILLKAELGYRMAKNWSAELIPSFRSSLSPVNMNSTVPVYPFNFGMGAGIRYSF